VQVWICLDDAMSYHNVVMDRYQTKKTMAISSSLQYIMEQTRGNEMKCHGCVSDEKSGRDTHTYA
jgi:hypothetical protein